MNNTRYVVPILLGICLVLSGCGMASPLAGTAPVTLRYAYTGATPEIQLLLDAFEEEHPNVTVELLGPEIDSGTVMQRALQGEIDLIRSGTDAMAMAERGLLPLDDIHLDAWADIREDYYGGLWESLSLAGEQYGIPAGLDTVVMYVNVDALNALGQDLPPDNQPWDNYAFLDLATRLNHPEGLPGDPTHSVFGFCSNHQDLDPFVFVYANGGSIVDDLNDPQRPTLDDMATVDALAFYVDLFTRYGVAPGADFMGRNYGAASRQVAQAGGHCGLWIGLFSQRGQTDSNPWQYAWEMLPVPGSQPDLGLSIVEGYFIPRTASHPEEALELARFLSDRWEASGRLLPPRRSLVQEPGYQQLVGDRIAAHAAAFSDDMNVISLDFDDKLMNVGMAVLDAVDYAITQNEDIVPLLQEAQQTLERSFGP